MKKLNKKHFAIVLGVFLILINFAVTKYELLHTIIGSLNSVIYGFVIAYLMEPLVKFIIKKTKGKVRRGVAVFITVLIVIAMIILIGAILVPTIISSSYDIGEKISNQLEGGFDFNLLDKMLEKNNNEALKEVITYVNSSLKDIVTKLGEYTTSFINTLIKSVGVVSSSILKIFMAFIVAIYMLLDKKDLLLRIKKINYAYNERKTADNLLRITNISNDVFKSFFVGKILDSIVIGILCFLAVWIFKIPNAPAIGFFVGLTNIIPYFGPFIGAIPAIIFTLASGTLYQVLAIMAIIFALQQFDGLYLGPKILGDKVGVAAFWIIIAVSIGGYIAGVIGMVVGVPVLVVVMTILDEDVEKRLKENNLENLE